MSRSYRKAILKDKGKFNFSYNKTVRRVNKQIVNQFKTCYTDISIDDLKDESIDGYLPNISIQCENLLKDPKEIINDYDISDFKTNFEAFTSKELEKYDLIQDKIKLRKK